MTDFWFGVITVLVLEGTVVGLVIGGKTLWAKIVAALKTEINKL